METGFFILSKLVGALLRAESWILLLLLFGAIACWRGRHRRGRVLSGAGGLLLLALTVLPLGDLAIRPFETWYPVAPELGQVDGIIVLGGAEQAGLAKRWGRPQMNDAAERFTEGAALAYAHPRARLVFSGGSGALADLRSETVPQAGMAKSLFEDLGIPSDRILLEDTSRNTAENARNSFDMLKPRQGQVWVLVTSAYHMPRAMRSFRAAGWPDLIPWPVDHRSGDLIGGLGWDLAHNLRLFNAATKEAVGLIAYTLTGQ